MGIFRDASMLESGLPQLKNSQYEITSGADAAYNCIAWVFRDTKNWWELGRYWPSQKELGDTVNSIARFFEAFDFTVSDRSDLETGFEKIAIYADHDGYFTHVARQEPDGSWSSKLGKGNDIKHAALGCLEGRTADEYGRIACFMKRSTGATTHR